MPESVKRRESSGPTTGAMVGFCSGRVALPRRIGPARRAPDRGRWWVNAWTMPSYLLEGCLALPEDALVELARRVAGIAADQVTLVELVDQAADHLGVDRALEEARHRGAQDHQ